MNEETNTTNEQTATKVSVYRGKMKKAMEYIKNAQELRVTPEELAVEADVPGMTAYRALKESTNSGITTMSYSDRIKGKKGPIKRVYCK